jgi:hypothetical protein
MDINWDSPARGITECRIKLAAEGHAEAAQILAPYFAERLRLVTLDRAIPTDAKQIEADLFWRLSICSDALSALLTLHLFTQTWLEQGIERILIQTAPEGYLQKVKVLLDSHKLTNALAHNLRQLNWLRNQFAHRLGTNWSDLEMRFESFDGVYLSGVKPSADPDHELYVFKVIDKLVLLTYRPLVEQLSRQGVTPVPE